MRKIFVFLIIFCISLISVSAIRFVNYNFYEGIISFDGNLIETGNPVNNVNVIGFTCLDENCENLGERIFDNNILNSGVFPFIQLYYPTNLLSNFGYGVYYYKNGYIPWESNPNWWGINRFDPQGPLNVYLTKKEGCTGFISNLNVENTAKPHLPLVVSFTTGIDARTSAAIREAGPLNAVPDELKEHYKIKQSVNLNVFDASNNSIEEQSMELFLEFGENKEVSFTFVPTTIGKHKIVLTSTVNDEKCLSSNIVSTSKETTVVSSERPRDLCYVLLNNVSVNNLRPNAGDTITISGKKISNEFRNISREEFIDFDNDGFNNEIDCNDDNNKVYPNAPELLDDIDQNCKNDEPVLEVNDLDIFEGEFANLSANIYDLDGDILRIEYQRPFDRKGEWKTKIGNDGVRDVSINVSDGKAKISRIVNVNIRRLPGRDKWDYFRDGRIMESFIEDRKGNDPLPLGFGHGTRTDIVTNVFMEKDRNIGIGFFCDNVLNVFINDRLELIMIEPGFAKRFANDTFDLRGPESVPFTREDIGTLKLKKGWSKVHVSCKNNDKGSNINGHIDMHPRLSKVVDLMTNDNRTIDVEKLNL